MQVSWSGGMVPKHTMAWWVRLTTESESAGGGGLRVSLSERTILRPAAILSRRHTYDLNNPPTTSEKIAI
jgi:hypothetical protein